MTGGTTLFGILLIIFGGGAVAMSLTWSDGLPSSDGRPTGMSRDDVKNAALEIVWPLPQCSESWIGGTVEQCDAAQKRLEDRRREFSNFEPPWMRKAIFEWLDYAQREINEAREDCHTQKSRRDLDRYRDEMNGEQERAREILRSIGR